MAIRVYIYHAIFSKSSHFTCCFCFAIENATPPTALGQIRGVLESFESDLSRAPTRFWFYVRQEHLNFENEHFDPLGGVSFWTVAPPPPPTKVQKALF